jgi:hypothetical protein
MRREEEGTAIGIAMGRQCSSGMGYGIREEGGRLRSE